MTDASDKLRPKGEDDGLRKVRDIDELHKAAKSGDVERIKGSKLEEMDINAPNQKGLTALHIACREGNFDVVAELLKRGANIAATTKKRNTPLHVASLGGKLEIVRLLLEHGAEVNKQAENEMTSLYMAAQENHIDVAKELLRHNADPRLSASGGFEPVDVAIQQKHSEMTAFLMEQGSKRGFKALHVIARKDASNAAALLLSDGFDPNVAAPNGYTPLHIAAKYGSMNTALLLIEASANVNTIAKHNITPLHVAAKHGQTEIVSVLIEAEAKLDISTKDGLTPLHCAARDGHEDCVELLLVHNASLNAKTRHGLTALHMAAQGNHANCANLLLGHGCHIDSQTLEGVSPLHVAAHYGSLKIAKLLLDRGADVDKQAKNGYTALHVACKKNREDVVQLLIRYGANVHLKNIRGQTALHLASYFGMVNIVLILLENEAFIEERTSRDETSLHIACRTKQITVARLLLRNGAKVDPRSKTFETPLWIACRQGYSDIVLLLLQHGANPDARNKDDATYLHIAASNGNEAITECLLDHGARIDLRNKQQCTSLHEAARRGHSNVARMLIEKNADVNAEAKNSLRPLHLSCHYRHADVSVLLMENGANLQVTAKNGFTPLHIVSKNNAVELALNLLSNGVDADTTTKNGISPLHLAAKEGNVKIADALLDNGASPGIQTKNGLTPLHLAAKYNQIEVTKRLIKYAAPINAQTTSGYTPLHFACFYGHDEIVKLLLQEGADVEAKTRHANTPLHITALKGYSSITAMLLKYNTPTNTLNKDGFTALYIAEITQHTGIADLLAKVTHVVIRKKELEANESVKLKYSAPEELEEGQLIEIAEESDIEASKERLAVTEDFEESFLGFDESGLADAGNESIASNKTTDFDTSTTSASRERLPENTTPVFESSPPAIFLSSEDNIHLESLEEMEPPVTGGFLISFLVNAKGGTFESRQTGIRVTIPRGACSMPTRITCRLLRESQKIPMPKFYINEGLVSRIVEISPQGMQFLKPITLEVPHFGSLRKRERELLVLRSDPDSDFWREHVSTRSMSEVNDLNGFSEMPTSPEHGFKSGTQFVRIVTQDFPERFAIVARPRKEKFLMFTEAGIIKSGILPKMQVEFKENTLNISTKILLQVQIMDDSILQPDETAKFSSIIRLQPHIKLSTAVTAIMPCAWIKDECSSSVSTNLRLLALMPDNENDMNEHAHWIWKDVTDVCSLTGIDDCCQFETSFLTTYWLIDDKVLEKIPAKAESIYRRVCLLPFVVKFVVYASVLSPNSAELRVFCMTDDKTEKALEQREGFIMVARSRDVEVYDEQVVHLTCSGTVISGSKSLKLSFTPFKENRLAFKVAGMNSAGPWSYRIGFISSLRQDADGRVPLLCNLEAVITEKMLRGKIKIPRDSTTYKVSDDLLQIISRNIGPAWKDLATHLQMSDSDIQGVVDLTYVHREVAKTRIEQDRSSWEMTLSESSDEHVLASLTLLELWRTTKGNGASFENLRNALETIGRGDLCDLVECRSPVTLSPRSSHSGSVKDFGERKPEEAVNLDGILTAEKQIYGHEKSQFEFPVSMKPEVGAKVNSDVDAVSRADSTVDFGEEAIVESKLVAERKDTNLHDLMNNLSGEEEFFDTVESLHVEENKGGNLRDAKTDERDIVVTDDEIKEEKRVLRPGKDKCEEDEYQETVVNDVHCKVFDDDFAFMREEKQIVSGDSSNAADSSASLEENSVSRDENSNFGLVPEESPAIALANGNAADETQGSNDMIKKMFAGEQSVLAFFDTPEKAKESDEIRNITFV